MTTPNTDALREALDALLKLLDAAYSETGDMCDRHDLAYESADFLRDHGNALIARLTPAEAAPQEHGSWIAADDVYRMTRDIDVALNGEEGAARRPALCDVTAQIKQAARKRGGPLLAALSSTGESAPDAWLPIESAPADIADALVAWKDKHGWCYDFEIREDGRWFQHENRRETFEMVGGSGAVGPGDSCVGPPVDAPYTHWQPLTPPATQAERTGAERQETQS